MVDVMCFLSEICAEETDLLMHVAKVHMQITYRNSSRLNMLGCTNLDFIK